MPIVTLSVPDVHESVGRAVIMQAARQVMKKTNISDQVRIYYKGKSASIATPGTQLDDGHGREALMENRRTIFIEATEDYSLDDISRIRSSFDDNLPIFRDLQSKLYVRPIYINSNITLNIRFRTYSETDAKRWMSEMLVLTDRGRIINIHSFAYQYPFQEEVLELIEEVYKRREKIEPYGQSFADYFRNCADSRVSIISNRTDFDKQSRSLVIRERQSRVQGFYEFTGVPNEPSKENDTGLWEISFEYKFMYQRPEQVRVEYPLVVHNQVLPAKYTGENIEDDVPNLRPQYYSHDLGLMSMFEIDRDSATRSYRMYPNAPEWDMFKPTVFPQATSSLFQALVLINENKRHILNLNDLGDYCIDPAVLKFMIESEIPYLTKLHKSILHINVYEFEEIYNEDKLEVTPEFKLQSKVDMSLRPEYRVRISVVYDLRFLDKDALDRLKKYPEAMDKIVDAINGAITFNPDFQDDLHGRKPIYPWDIDNTIFDKERGDGDITVSWNDLLGKKPPYMSLEDFIALMTGKNQLKTMQTSWLIARRVEEANQWL